MLRGTLALYNSNNLCERNFMMGRFSQISGNFSKIAQLLVEMLKIIEKMWKQKQIFPKTVLLILESSTAASHFSAFSEAVLKQKNSQLWVANRICIKAIDGIPAPQRDSIINDALSYYPGFDIWISWLDSPLWIPEIAPNFQWTGILTQ